jgi:hypothetical protein
MTSGPTVDSGHPDNGDIEVIINTDSADSAAELKRLRAQVAASQPGRRRHSRTTISARSNRFWAFVSQTFLTAWEEARR